LNPIRYGALDKNSFITPTILNLKKLIDGYEDIIKIRFFRKKVEKKCSHRNIKGMENDWQ